MLARTWTNFALLLALSTVSSPALGCGDYCDAYSGLYNTGGYSLYDTVSISISGSYSDYSSSDYGYGSSYGGGCGSFSGSCGSAYDYSGLYGSNYGLGYSSPSYFDTSLISGSYGGGYGSYGYDGLGYGGLGGYGGLSGGFTGGFSGGYDIGCSLGYCSGGGYLPYPSASTIPPLQGPSMWPAPAPMFPPYTVTMAPLPPPMMPNPYIDSTIPIGGTTTRFPPIQTTTYTPPTTQIPWGGCDGVIVACPTGPTTRPPFPTNPVVTTPPVTTPPGNTFTPPTTQVVSNTGQYVPSSQTGNTPPVRQTVPRGVRASHGGWSRF